MENKSKVIAEKIKQIRKMKELNHENMAYELGISQVAYSKIEKGETRITVDRLFQIADILKVPAIDLLDLNAQNIFNQENRDNSIGQVVNMHNESKEAYELLIRSLKEEIEFLRAKL